ncbi:inosine-uridine preferring nucleoside hydrolase [Arthrobacter sp. SLBN-83]|uniref:nucleoside hydrolase n=1 Tax=Arthrobacter sp. SLBN-83 TaxID=2768449 RepID=UPI0011503BBB|nr:nucleoside hydrolase [Arthrobacter sp. SLBN-83]TQJ61438.1 inosine-uridine preferring nucleoside hydrolase [Arthrobacter sp. SLBN-83]
MDMIRIEPRCRVVIDNDWAGDPDGLVALAHHAMSPANKIVAVTSSLTNPMFGPPCGMAQAGADLAEDLLRVLKLPGLAGIHAGPDIPFTGQPRNSPAARAIVDAAGAVGDLPLLLVCAGPLTNVADALLLEPAVARSFTLVWVGGAEKDEEEYNYFTDPAAADFVLGNRDLALWQFPAETYRQVVVPVAELDHAFRNAGPAGAWLWEHFNSLEVPDFVKFGPLWCLGDSAPLVVTGLDDLTSTYVETSAKPQRRRYTSVDTRLVMADFVAKLRLQA